MATVAAPLWSELGADEVRTCAGDEARRCDGRDDVGGLATTALFGSCTCLYLRTPRAQGEPEPVSPPIARSHAHTHTSTPAAAYAHLPQLRYRGRAGGGSQARGE